MSKFAPKELCEKLQSLGCTTDSYMIWVSDAVLQTPVLTHSANLTYLECCGGKFLAVAFYQNDFTGADVEADENCKKVWGEQMVLGHLPEFGHGTSPSFYADAWAFHRHVLLEIHRNDMVWWEYLERTMVK